MFNPAVCLDHVFQRKCLDPERNRSRTNGGIQADERFMRHGTVKCRPRMATEMWFGLDAIGIGKRRPCFQMRKKAGSTSPLAATRAASNPAGTMRFRRLSRCEEFGLMVRSAPSERTYSCASGWAVPTTVAPATFASQTAREPTPPLAPNTNSFDHCSLSRARYRKGPSRRRRASHQQPTFRAGLEHAPPVPPERSHTPRESLHSGFRSCRSTHDHRL